MRITISSPDGLGDFVLRMPLIQALLDAGHAVQLSLRRPAADLAAETFPDAECLEISADPYHADTRRRKNPFRREHRAIRKFRPDLYVASLFARNFYDEVWFEQDQWRLPVGGFSTGDAFWPPGTVTDPSRLAERFRFNVKVPVSLPELEKNRLLGSAILGHEMGTAIPRLAPHAVALEAARGILRQHGLREGEYWIACVGHRSGIALKDWGEENWRAFFSEVIPGGNRPVVFLGNPKESPSVERIRTGNFSSINLASEPPAIPVSTALAALAAGYVGRDSGVMHMTCAVGRPVLAAFAGGHWGRFFPSSGPAVVVTQAMSCRMCDFVCPHERPHCITDISLETMRRAWERLPVTDGVEILEQPRDPKIDTISQEAAQAFARDLAVKRTAKSSTAGTGWHRIKRYTAAFRKNCDQVR